MIKECIMCGKSFEANGKQKICTICKKSKDYGKWSSNHYKYGRESLISNIDIADNWNGHIASISCKHCGKAFTHNAIKIDSKTVIPVWCEEHRNYWKRYNWNEILKPHDIEIEYEKIIELGQAINDIPQAIRTIYGIENDVDIKVYDAVYNYIKETRGLRYFK